MKSVFVLLVLCLIATSVIAWRGYTHEHDGRPGCQTDEEMQRVNWRNNFDANAFWVCKSKGTAGEKVRCKPEMLFQAGKEECVHYLEWVYVPNEDPPSMA